MTSGPVCTLAVAAGHAGILEETYIEGASRWHHLTRDTVDVVRAGLAPRARLALWPALSADIDAVLEALPADGLVEGVWQDKDGQLHSVVAHETEFPMLAAWIAAAVLSMYVDERAPLCTAVMPDRDGVLRARRRTEPASSDRTWAFLTPCTESETIT